MRKFSACFIVQFIAGLMIGGVVIHAFLTGLDVTDVAGTITLNRQYVSQYTAWLARHDSVGCTPGT